jgi:hypothetical protein
MNIGTVTEGPTDQLVIQAIIDKVCPGEHRYFFLQPPITLGETGAGWKGVKTFCQFIINRTASNLERFISSDSGAPLDLLVFHLDADVAAEVDLQADIPNPVANVRQACPPASDTADKLRAVLCRWLQQEILLPQTLVMIPAQDTETWVFAALFPQDALCQRPDYECLTNGRDHPGYRLTLKKYGKLLARKKGRPDKSVRTYEDMLAPAVAKDWETVCQLCPQARAFNDDLKLEGRCL